MVLIITVSLSLFLITQVRSQNGDSSIKLNYSNIIPEDKAKNILTLEGNPVEAIMLYQNDTLYVCADDIMKILGLTGGYDLEKSSYLINGQEFSTGKVYEVNISSKKKNIVFLPVVDLLKFLKLRYTLSNLGEYPTVRIQTSSFSLPTPTPLPVAAGTSAQGTVAPTPAPQQLFSQKCSKCHDLSRVTSEAHPSSYWSTIVPRMQSKDPQWITNEEATIILQYLSSGGR